MINDRNPTVSKVAHSGLHIGSGQFYAYDDQCALSRSVEFTINSDNAYDGEGNSIDFIDIYYAVCDIVQVWNEINDANITYTVSDEESEATWDNNPNGEAVICFSNGYYQSKDTAANALPGNVIRFNADYLRWNVDVTYPPTPGGGWPFYGADNWGPKDFRHILAHELGHTVGLGHCYSGYTYNTMYSDSGARNATNNRTLEWGDKAGGVYTTPQPKGTIDFTEIWAGCNPIDITESITIPSGVTVTIHAGKTLRIADSATITVNGSLIVETGFNTTFTKAPGGSGWSYLTVGSTGTLDFNGPATIEYGNGIILNGAIDMPYAGTTIQHCQGGVWVYNTETLNNLSVLDCVNSQGICTSSASAHVYLDCVLINDTPLYGLYLSSGDATVEDTKIMNTSSHSIKIYTSGCDLNMSGGHNDIYPGANYAVSNLYNVSLNVTGNYWGSASPDPADIFQYPNPAYLTWEPYDSTQNYAGPAKVANIAIIRNPIIEAHRLLRNGDWRGAKTILEDTLISDANPVFRKIALKELLKITHDYIQDFAQIRGLIEKEQVNASAYDYAVYNGMLIDIIVYEGSYSVAIADCINNAEQYTNTPMEVEMLCKAAIIAGDYLQDKSNAKNYADLAASINPGAQILLSAYGAIGYDYKPWEYVDIFAGKKISYQIVNEKGESNTSQYEDYIRLSPNPANPITTISYSLSEASHISIDVYNISGQKISTLVNSSKSAGIHNVTFNGSDLASGVYFYIFKSAKYSQTGKFLILK